MLQIVASPRFEIFFALWSLLRRPSPRLEAWREQTLPQLREDFWQLERALGGAPEFWIALIDAPGKAAPTQSFAKLLASFSRLSPQVFLLRLLLGALHDLNLARQVASGQLSLFKALASLGPEKRPWLAFIGLYPALPKAPMLVALQQAIETPQRVLQMTCQVLELFWQAGFAKTWRELAQPFEQRCRQERESFAKGTLAKHFQRLDLNITCLGRPARLKALRGGYQIALGDLRKIWLLPSVFNEERFWTVLGDGPGEQEAFIPFFVDWPGMAQGAVDAPLDPALVFRALGDATRFAMATLLARAPLAPVELARALGISKASVSHHLDQMRHAGLLQEEAGQPPRLRRQAIAALSKRALEELYGPEATTPMARSRKN